ncbi:MAG TPA: hypothetical protein VES20_22360 [Bryobacteraceae bacterium]|nr:hypothetical protein [Bryobacteraceae bacterium]
MRIDNYRVSPASEIRRGEGAARTAERASFAHRTQSEGDLLALSSGISNLARSTSVEAVAEAWKSGSFRPDPARIASRLAEWGFGRGDA